MGYFYPSEQSPVQADNPVGQKVLEAAKKSIGSFELFNYAQWGFWDGNGYWEEDSGTLIHED